MNRTATPIRPRLRPAPILVVQLDLTDEGQRRLHDLIRRFHTGRWPLFRALGMRQHGGVLYEAVEWLRMARPNYTVVKWRPDGSGLSWQVATSARAALAALLTASF